MKVNLGSVRFWWREHDDVGRGRNGGKGWNFQNPKNRRRITNCKLVQTAQLGSCEQDNVKQQFNEASLHFQTKLPVVYLTLRDVHLELHY